MARHGSVTPLLLGLLASSLLACFEPTSVVCPRSGRICAVACSADGEACISNLCGNGSVDPGEVCDDGNIQSGDNCSLDCKSEEICGNNYMDEVKGEACDDGNTRDGDGCSADCRSKESCGNRIVDPEEQCDDDNDSNLDDCLTACKMARCGDGFLNSQGLVTEACDYKNPESGPCNLDCTVASCGDGRVSPSTNEQCDTGLEDSATCDVDCTVPKCGDGHVNVPAGEECDDGNTNELDGCLRTCKKSRCGDGFADESPGHEEACDDGNTINETECPYGSQSCSNFCNADCTRVLHLEGSYCGDRTIDAAHGEFCDDGNTINEDECPFGMRECRFCNADCSAPLVITAPVCGNGILEPREACDDGNDNSCGSCNATCTVPIPPGVATGSIRLEAGGQDAIVQDGETFSLGDGLHRKVFEFDTSGGVVSGRVRVLILDPMDARDIAHAMAEAISDQPDEALAISASVSNTSGSFTVTLWNLHRGADGNKSIKEWVRSSSFTVNGMSGGGAGNCPEDTGCTSNSDCKPGLICGQHVCTSPD
jgi:cysteine-rich repeat protein